MKRINDITIHTNSFDETVIEDTLQYCSNLYHNIHLMPDTHRGATVPVGFVAKVDIEKGIIPEIIGVDIGCSIAVYEIPKLDIENTDWKALYEHRKTYTKRTESKPKHKTF